MSSVSSIVRCIGLQLNKSHYFQMAAKMSETSSTSNSGSFSSNRNYSMTVKEHLEICKFKESNFALWKNHIKEV